MCALGIFTPARRLLRYALDFMHRKPLTIDAGQGEQGRIQTFKICGRDKPSLEDSVNLSDPTSLAVKCASISTG